MARSREPVKHTCPDIDSLIKTLTEPRYGIVDKLEELRDANDKLRQWGNEEAERVDELESENEILTEQNDRLLSEIESLKETILSLEKEISEFAAV